ncbi:MAG: xanthine dehydrogenase family protein molybdopterin-binding subunit [Proteobacteria bacterium]|nr:xanthine dehydrogenase family protein molybdopterin-binding subunit [Pseudomonadota bacterium]
MKNQNTSREFSIVNAALLPDMSRRDLIKGAGLTLAVLGGGSLLTACASGDAKGGPLTATQYLRIDTDGTVTVISPQTELGQGAYTGLATLAAEELDADWSKVKVEGAPADVKLFGNPAFGGALQGTGGSSTAPAFWEPMRKAGATARAMLVAAAAADWGVPAGEITVKNGVVSHAGKNKSAGFGELVGAAAKQPTPKEVKLKDPKDFTLIGQPARRVDSEAKSTGTAMFTQDIKLPDMLITMVTYPPRFGGKVKSFDAAAAKAMPGVVDVVQFRTPLREGVAVLAKDTWTAKKARDAVKVDWDESSAYTQSSSDIIAEYKVTAQKPGLEAKKQGDAAKALAGAARRIEAEYEFPFLAHAAMEPMNCVVQLKDGACEIWNGEQMQTPDQGTIGKFLNLKPEQIKINMLYAGGSFGRRGNSFADYLLDTVAIAQAGAQGKPVKLVWTREDDMRAGFYRPVYLHSLKAAVDKSGKITGWQQRIVGQSILAGSPLDNGAPVDFTSVEGAANLPYAIPNLQVELHTTKLGVPIQWWRSVGSTHTAYAIECFIDDIARATKQDPVELRRTLLADKPRYLAVLNAAAEKSGWGKPLPAGTARGIAIHESFNTVVAEVVEVRKQGNGFKVDKVYCVVDCGIAINPNIVEMQMESSIIYGLAAIATGAITLKEGRVEQSNFHDYTVLRMNQVPKIEVHIMPSTSNPTGVGEPGTPPIGPAVANALTVLTGKTYRQLPLTGAGVTIV